MRWLSDAEIAVLLLGSTAAICFAQPQGSGPARAHTQSVPSAKPSSGPARKSASYVDAKCGFKFTYMSIWTVTREPISQPRDSCEYRISFTRKTAKGILIHHRVEVYVSDHEFDGFDKEGFEFKNGVWHEDRGIAGNATAHEILGINWVGMNMPEGPSRCLGKEGYEGIGDHPTATLFGQTIKRMAQLDGGQCEHSDVEAINMLIPTFEFIPTRNNPGNRP